MRTFGKHGHRYYVVDEENEISYPSVTSILSAMTDKSGLDSWRKRVGDVEADRLSEYGANRGSFMHLLAENYLDSRFVNNEEDNNVLLKKIFIETLDDELIKTFKKDALIGGKNLFMNFIQTKYFDDLSEVVIQEVALFSNICGGYAGRVDLIAKDLDGTLIVVDFKSSGKPKKRKWIDNYFMQISAYAFAYYQMFGEMPQRCEVWISNELDIVPQKFTLTLPEMKEWYIKFIELVKGYHKKYI